MAHPIDTPPGIGDMTLAEWALAVACGVAAALLGWVFVVFAVVALT